MLPYGISRKHFVEFPDIADIQNFALKSSVGRVTPKNGKDYKSYTRNAKARRAVRIHQHHIARNENKKITAESINDYFNHFEEAV